MKLFDLIKVLFNGKKGYDKLTNYDKSKNRFMVQRFMSIEFPDVAELLNINGTNGAYIIDSFRLITRSRYNRVPGWVYTKTKKTKKKDSGFEPEDSTVKFFLKKYDTTMRDYNEILKSTQKEELLKELEELEQFLKENGWNK